MHDTWYFTDIHGNLELYKKIMKSKIFKPEDTIIFGGDACDRGEYGYELMHTFLDNPYIVYLKGNHEDMFVNAAYMICDKLDDENMSNYQFANRVEAEEWLKENIYNDEDVALSIYNGGLPTLTAWMEDGHSRKLVDQIAALPITYSYENMDFCHAGGSVKAFQEIAKCEYYDKIENYALYDANVRFLLWDRHSFMNDWEPNRILVHGHTPTKHIPISNMIKKRRWNIICGPILYNVDSTKGWRLDMDCGTYNNGIIYVLNCTTHQMYRVDANSEFNIQELDFKQF